MHHQVSGAVRNLSTDNENKRRLASAGACEQVAQLLTKYGEDNAEIAEQVL
jgi:hypothetical protein